MKDRKPLLPEAAKPTPDVYRYANSISYALEKGKIGCKVPAFKGKTTMQNTTGRDDKMYYVSEGFNLRGTNEN